MHPHKSITTLLNSLAGIDKPKGRNVMKQLNKTEIEKGYAYTVFNGAKGYVTQGKVRQDQHYSENADLMTYEEFIIMKAQYDTNPYKTLHFEPIKK